MFGLDLSVFLITVKKFLYQNLLIVIIFSAGLVLFLIGLMTLLIRQDKTEEALSAGQDPEREIQNKNIVIDIEGAVILPGVYKLTTGSRVQDALISAGGLSQKADREYVAKHINLAKIISDSEKIYIPFFTESKSVLSESTVSNSNLININTADQDELDGLPGVGSATARKIINGRPYEKTADLSLKNIISKSLFEKIKDKITVY